MPYEDPSGRRVNVLAAYEPLAAAPWRGSCALERTPASADVLAYLRGLPAADVPRVVVLDNAGVHASKEVKGQRRALARAVISLYYLPPYSPELSEVEPVFTQVTYHDIPIRSHTSRAELRVSVEGGFEARRQHLRMEGNKSLRRGCLVHRTTCGTSAGAGRGVLPRPAHILLPNGHPTTRASRATSAARARASRIHPDGGTTAPWLVAVQAGQRTIRKRQRQSFPHTGQLAVITDPSEERVRRVHGKAARADGGPGGRQGRRWGRLYRPGASRA
jgi:transposase